MKILFLIAALAGAVYLVLQTPAGKAWLESDRTQVKPQLAQQSHQKQLAKIKQLENKIVELEKELTAVNALQVQTLDEAAKSKIPTPVSKSLESRVQEKVAVATVSERELQRMRQARLQDIAEKMELSSLQALLN